ncbi:MAG: HAD-IB family hydrolase [Novosphingobium sp.]
MAKDNDLPASPAGAADADVKPRKRTARAKPVTPAEGAAPAKSPAAKAKAAPKPRTKAAPASSTGEGEKAKAPRRSPARTAAAKPAVEPDKPSLPVVKASPAKAAKKAGRDKPSALEIYKQASERRKLRKQPEKLSTAPDIIQEIAAGPQGPSVIAAFDFDGTLLGGLSGAMLMQERFRRKDVKRAEITDQISSTFKMMTKKMEGHELVTRSFMHWAGKTKEEMEDLAEHLFETKIQDSIFPEMREIMAAHRAAGHTIVVATAATRYQVERMVKELGVDHLLCTEVEIVDGKLTGRLVGESLFGAGKAEALKRFISEHGGHFDDTHFYADGSEEIGLMETVGHPHPVNAGRQLGEAAKKNGWPVLRLTSRGSAKPKQVARGIAGLMKIVPIMQAGLAIGLLTKDKRQASNHIMPAWIQAQFDKSEVKLRVSGRKNLHARRPAVFIFNHRNNYDGMIAAVLIRTDVAGVGKKDIGKNPIGKLGTMVVPTVLVERGGGDPQKAAEMMQPLVDAVEQGYSIMVSPEGTRVRGHHGSVGTFKKGAFHMAMAAGIPIIPIVIRNALDVASRDGALRPGTVDVAVLPPVPIDDWTRENLAEKVESVRQLYISTLNDWPAPDEDG